jgi:hypothetical protein
MPWVEAKKKALEPIFTHLGDADMNFQFKETKN